ncbi:MAG: hypothetical protein JO189_01705 [Deltaproteobacteria bacterium]|nr:hypothetical protein [Deltaproteobacteria bacterium]
MGRGQGGLCFSLLDGFMLSRARAVTESLLRDGNPMNIGITNFPDHSHMESRACHLRQSRRRLFVWQTECLNWYKAAARNSEIGGGSLAHRPLGFATGRMKTRLRCSSMGLALTSALGYPKTLVRMVGFTLRT